VTKENLTRLLLAAFLLVSVYCAPRAWATIGYEQNAYNQTECSSCVVVNYQSAQTAADLNVVVVSWADATTAIDSITDTSGNAYALAVGPTVLSGSATQAVYYAKNIAAAAAQENSVIVTFSGSATAPDVRIAEYAGLNTRSPLDVTGSSTGTGTQATAGPVTTTNASDLLIAVTDLGAAATAPTSGWNSRLTTPGRGNLLEDQIVASTGAYSASATLSTSDWWVMQLVTFKGAAGATIKFVQAAYNQTECSNCLVMTFPGTQALGDLDVVVASWADSTTQIQSVKDTSGNSYALAVGPTVLSGTGTQSIYYAQNIAAAAAGANSVIVTFNGEASSPDVRVAEYAGIVTTNALDVAVGASGQSALSSSGSVTTTNPYDLLIGANNVDTESTGPGAGWTQDLNTLNYGDILEHQIVTNTGSYAATAPMAASDFWIMQIAAFKGIAAQPPTAPTGLSAAAVSSAQINLSWGASSSASGIGSYRVERCSGAGCTNFLQVATPTTTAYSDTGLTSATPYSYRVSASDTLGNLSGYSNVAAATVPTALGAAGSATYDYDALGRLVQVVSPTLGSVQSYAYDAAGNITSSITTSITTLSIGGTSVSSGSAGAQVTIYGSGFSTTASSDVVTIDGVSATVVSATATQLVITIPPGAVTDPIVISTGGSSVASSTSFTISTSSPAPVITGLSPTLGAPGAALTITGTGFDPATGNNKIQFNTSVWGSADSDTGTSLGTAIPQQAAWGKIHVLTPNGQAVSPIDFFSPPTGYTVATIGSTGRLAPSTAAVISVPTAGLASMQVFDGTAGGLFAIGISSNTLASSTLKIFSPSGALFTSATVSSSTQGVQLPPLSASGTYAVIVDAGSNTGSITLALAPPQTATLIPGGASVALSLTPPGERALVTFSGTSGQYLTLGLTSDTVSSATITISQPNGTTLLSKSVTSSTNGVQLPALPTTGNYTILVDPGTNSGNITVALITPLNGTLTVGGASLPLSLTPIGQRGFVTFSGTAGQYLTLELGSFGSALPVGTISLTTPSGTQLSSSSFNGSTLVGSIQLPVLPSTGTYTIFFDPGQSSENLTLSLVPAVAFPAQSNDSGIVNLSDANARAEITFTGTPGEYVAVAIMEGISDVNGFDTTSEISGIQTTVLAPDGSVLNGTALMGFQNPTSSFTCATGPCYGNSIINLGPLPSYAAGSTYTVIVQQTGGTGGYLNVTVSNAVANTTSVAVGGGETPLYFSEPGRPLLVPVTGIAVGHGYAVTLTETGGNMPVLDGLLLNSLGQQSGGFGLTATCASPCTIGAFDLYSGTESDGVGTGAGGTTGTLIIQQETQTSGANAYGPLSGVNVTVSITLLE
jgi:YD repeat-containing protein